MRPALQHFFAVVTATISVVRSRSGRVDWGVFMLFIWRVPHLGLMFYGAGKNRGFDRGLGMNGVDGVLSMMLVIVGLAAWVNGIAAHVLLVRMDKSHPNVLRRVGIQNVDWWFACLRGVFALAMTQQGLSVPAGTRWVLRGVVATYAVLIVYGIVTMLRL
ncbi:hypothetical protein [Stenotrophomonas sp. Marseille-Q5258]|uniref:hypothetical protein n=1 Tax=Stenotrophomonas sp. Marseille-Q5258 TaxID=2972779 RepID=UPI0021C75408|nr:hypothetical protein [Stenotrophomonas sp. Marseille-Q5258]